MDGAQVRVEFYGLARRRAGRTEFQVKAKTIGTALLAIESACPSLRLIRDGELSGEYRLSVDGVRFTSDVNEPLAPGEALLILGADFGG